MGTHEAETDLGTMSDGARDTVAIIMTTIEITIETAIDLTIKGSEAETGHLAKEIVERCQAQRHGRSVDGFLGTTFVGFDQVQDSISRDSRRPISSSRCSSTYQLKAQSQLLI